MVLHSRVFCPLPPIESARDGAERCDATRVYLATVAALLGPLVCSAVI